MWLVCFDPTVGREIQKTRPCLIVSPDVLNRRFSTATGVPLTTGSRPEPFRPAITFAGKPGMVLCEQLRTLSTERFIKRLGEVDKATLHDVLDVLVRMFAP